jgi:hypothetical protein
LALSAMPEGGYEIADASAAIGSSPSSVMCPSALFPAASRGQAALRHQPTPREQLIWGDAGAHEGGAAGPVAEGWPDIGQTNEGDWGFDRPRTCSL